MARRMLRLTPQKLLLLIISLVIVSSLYLVFAPITEPCNCERFKNDRSENMHQHVGQPSEERLQERRRIADKNQALIEQGDDPRWGPHKLCILVPFRDRFEELLEFAPHMHKFLNVQKIRHKLVIINQGDKLRFNRATLINLGFLQTKDECDYMAMHDVDLLPLNPALSYSYPAKGPFHLAAPDLHPRYHYKTFVGGILLLTREHFTKCNGLSNRFWGWGREDDEFFVRMKAASLTVRRPQNITTGYSTFKHEHDKIKRPRDFKRYGDQKKDARYRDYKTGLGTVQSESIMRHESVIDGAPVVILNVKLMCDYDETPWCVSPNQLAKLDAERLRQHQDKEVAEAEIAMAKKQIEQAKLKMQVDVAAQDANYPDTGRR